LEEISCNIIIKAWILFKLKTNVYCNCFFEVTEKRFSPIKRIEMHTYI